MRRYLTLGVAACLLGTACHGPAPGLSLSGRSLHCLPSGYTLIDLGTLPGHEQSRATGLNEHGEVVGISRPVAGTDPIRGFLWSGDAMRDLGTMSGYERVLPEGINDRGEIVGSLQGSHLPERAFVWDGLFALIGPFPRGSHTRGADIDPRGNIVGVADVVAGEDSHAFLYEDGELIDLGALSGGEYSAAFALGERGDIVGVSEDALGRIVGVIWEDAVPQSLGTMLSVPDFQPFDLAPGGEMVGWSPERERAFLLGAAGAEPVDLGTLQGDVGESKALGLNQRLQVVGTSSTDSGIAHAFLWDDGQMIDLNDLIDEEMELLDAVAINDRGQIVGTARIDGEEHAYLLTLD